MSTVYVTYESHGSLKRGVLSQAQYSKYAQDPSIHNLQVYASQSLQEQAYNEAKGISGKGKSILFS